MKTFVKCFFFLTGTIYVLRYFYPFYTCSDRILKDDGCISYQHFAQQPDGFADFVPTYFMLGFEQRKFIFITLI